MLHIRRPRPRGAKATALCGNARSRGLPEAVLMIHKPSQLWNAHEYEKSDPLVQRLQPFSGSAVLFSC